MIECFLTELKKNPIPSLRKGNDRALNYYIDRDLREEPVDPLSKLWELPGAAHLVKKQLADGSWKYPGKTSDSLPGENYFLLETYRNLRVLVEIYGFTRAHETMQKAAAYVFRCQTEEGDIRGILGKQYMPYYHGAILELLVKTGFGDDPRMILGLDWLLAMRQDDGGWVVPTQHVSAKERTPEYWQSNPVLPDKRRPHAHMATGMVLRAFAVHPEYCSRSEVITAGKVLKKRFFKPDRYNDRKASSYWLKFQFPFWWNSLVSSLDSLGKIGFDADDHDISRGLHWFIENQEEDGLWPTGYGSGRKADENRRWVGLAICRVFKQFFSESNQFDQQQSSLFP